MRTFLLTFVALLAFAGNSILCRLALGSHAIDPAGFALVRLVSGAAVLSVLIAASRTTPGTLRTGSWQSAWWLFVYAAAFSLAYTLLGAGTGALILFACVQFTMIAGGYRAGERPTPRQWIGLATASGGLVYLAFPGLEAPPLGGALLMAVSGVAWGLYSLRGRGESRPLAATAGNFLRAVPFALLLAAIAMPHLRFSSTGILWAVLSGAVTSGLGYVLWYAALKKLTATRASLVQLAVPVLAALGGTAFLGETFSGRLAISAFVTLSGVALTLQRKTVLKV